MSEDQTYNGYSVDAEDQPQDTGDSTADDRGLAEPLDEGYSPPENWSAAQRFGNTPLEEELGESLEQRLAQEEPEPDPYVEAEREADDPDFDARDGEVGGPRAGRLIADGPEDGIARDVGIDGAGASAEEAAVHLVEEDLDD